jgi:UDP-hydrolysing UDP-N-acetyl-D-glucosamine 2-epimerase
MPDADRPEELWIIAEIGVNHDGDVGVAKELVAAAAEAGADAVKLQVFEPHLVATGDADLAPYQRERHGARSQVEMLSELALSAEDLAATRAVAEDLGIAWFATAFDLPSLRLVESLDPVAHKVPSGEITNLPFLAAIAALGRPVLLSTGMSTWPEVDAAVATLAGVPDLTLLHCVSAYPAPLEDANLLVLPEMARRYATRVGWSDHCPDPVAAIAAVALGATVLERHLTLDRTRPGPDHAASSDPTQLAAYVQAARGSFSALGDRQKVVRPSEVDNRRAARRSWHATRALAPGDVLTGDDVVALRPATGLSPSTAVHGAVVQRGVAAGHPLQAGDVVLPAPGALAHPVRKVCVFTSSRAEYGLLAPILRRIQQSEVLELQLVVAGSHLSHLHGHTIDQVQGDGFRVDAEVEMVLASDTPVAAAKGVGLALLDLAVQLDRLAPDVLVVLGDRYELLAVASAALLLNIPVAHVHGGELTEGAFDDAVRHAITKMSHLHFPAAEPFAQRIVQMGEPPDRVHVVGAPALDTLRSMELLPRQQVEEVVGYELAAPVALVAYHPVTLPGEDPAVTVGNLLEAVRARPFATIITGAPNADPAYSEVQRVLVDAASEDPRLRPTPSVGHEAFLSLMACSDVVVGNSSSALIEAPALKVPAVLVGRRQDGRPQAPSVLATGTSVEEIGAALDRAMDPGFRASLSAVTSPYDRGVSAADAIVHVLEHADREDLLAKRFHSIGR